MSQFWVVVINLYLEYLFLQYLVVVSMYAIVLNCNAIIN